VKKLFYVFLFFSVISCQDKFYYEKEYRTIDGWHRDSILKFEVEIADTTKPYSVFFVIDNDESYLYRNLYLFVTIDFPSGIKRVDTVDCILADSRGKWFGKEIEDNKYESVLLYRKNVIFPFKGKYIFHLEQAMRHKILKGINRIGLKIKEENK